MLASKKKSKEKKEMTEEEIGAENERILNQIYSEQKDDLEPVGWGRSKDEDWISPEEAKAKEE